MKLIVMRHCKSDWDHDGDDLTRPLSERGQKAAPKLGRWLQDAGHVPDLALVSDATRTAETWNLLGVSGEMQLHNHLYLANAATMLAVLKTGGAGDTVLMMGHNPGIASFAQALLEQPPSHPRFATYPAGATLVAESPGPWSEASFGSFHLVDFVIPREL